MPRKDGTPTIDEILGRSPGDVPRREPKPWPPEEDCPGCPSHKDGPHKLSCSHRGAGQVKLPLNIKDTAKPHGE